MFAVVKNCEDQGLGNELSLEGLLLLPHCSTPLLEPHMSSRDSARKSHIPVLPHSFQTK